MAGYLEVVRRPGIDPRTQTGIYVWLPYMELHHSNAEWKTGSAERLVESRPGSWEASHVRAMGAIEADWGL